MISLNRSPQVLSGCLAAVMAKDVILLLPFFSQWSLSILRGLNHNIDAWTTDRQLLSTPLLPLQSAAPLALAWTWVASS